MQVIKVDNTEERVWRMEILYPSLEDIRSILKSRDISGSLKTLPILKKLFPSKKKGECARVLESALLRCSAKLLLSDRNLTYKVEGFFHPNAIAAIDTKKQLLFMKSGTQISAKLLFSRLSISEADFVQNAIRNHEQKEWQENFDRRFKALEENKKTQQRTEEPIDENQARKLFALVEAMGLGQPVRKAQIFTVFRLYCMKGLSAKRVAEKCRCSKATIINRLKAIERATNTNPKKLQSYSPQFERIEESLSDPRARSISPREMIK
jgi:predicted DNA-binding protein YlxM (UPF0122 family)